jgi:hypothetical protein
VTEKHLEWRAWRLDVRLQPVPHHLVMDQVKDKWADPDAPFHVTKIVYDREQVVYRVYCNYIAKGADANDARRKMTQLFGPIVVWHMTITTLAVVNVDEFDGALPELATLQQRWLGPARGVIAIR